MAITPGEWWNESGVIHAKGPRWTEENHSCVHVARGIENEDDAKLIAAAPEMYRIFKEMLKTMWEVPGYDEEEAEQLILKIEGYNEDDDNFNNPLIFISSKIKF